MVTRTNYHKKKGTADTDTEPHQVPRHLRLGRLGNFQIKMTKSKNPESDQSVIGNHLVRFLQLLLQR